MSQDYTYIWFHIASECEWEQVVPLLECIKRKQAYRKILVTFADSSTFEKHKEETLADECHILPVANRRNVKKWISETHVEIAFFVSYYHVGRYIQALHKAGVQTYWLNALVGDTHECMHWSSWSQRKIIGCFNIIFAQNEATRDNLEHIKQTSTIVAGNTLIDRTYDVCFRHKEVIQLERFAEARVTPQSIILPVASPIIIAGDTWPEDEKLLARYVYEHPEVKLVLAPHEIGAEHLHYIFNLFQGRFVRSSQATMQNLTACQTLVVDQVVSLASCYHYGQVAYIGGGFNHGVHNVLEPAAQEVPILFGPNHHHSREAVALVEQGGAYSVNDYTSFENTMSEVLAQSKTIGATAKRYILAELGATNIIYNATIQ